MHTWSSSRERRFVNFRDVAAVGDVCRTVIHRETIVHESLSAKRTMSFDQVGQVGDVCVVVLTYMT